MYLEYFEEVLFQFQEISESRLGPGAVHKAQREHGIVVTLDGHGGDEALGGYPWHVTASLKHAISNESPLQTVEMLDIMKNLELFPRQQFYWKSIQTLGGKLIEKALKKKQNRSEEHTSELQSRL